MGDFKKASAVLSPVQQQGALRDRQQFLQQMALYRKLTRMAEEAKLDQQSPYKEVIEQFRMKILAEAKINDGFNQAVGEPAQIVNAYEDRKSKYAQVKGKAIYIAFSDSPESSGGGKKTL